MSDKKVGRFGGRPVTPSEQMNRALSDTGTVNVADLPHDKGKAAVADKFREREERWRTEQALHDQHAAHPSEPVLRPAAAPPAADQGDVPGSEGRREGGAG